MTDISATPLGHRDRRSTNVLTALNLGWRSVTARRRLQLLLGVIWLIDAALQYQPFMFGRSFVTEVIEPAAPGTPAFVAQPALWAAHVMIQHIALYNSFFATIQLLIALAIFAGPLVRIGLATSIVWALAVWWLAEGLGGITLGVPAVMGAPGAAVIYAVIAALVWPRRSDDHPPPEASVAERGLLGSALPKLIWTALWWTFAAVGLERANRNSTSLHAMVVGMGSGEPGWIGAMDRVLAVPLNHDGTEWSVALALLFALAGIGVWAPRFRRPAIVIAIVLALVIWLVEDFGGIFTGTGTDVNSGPLLALLAATLWPATAASRPVERRR